MSERINHDDMLQRVAVAREGWQVPGSYLVQAHDDAMALNRIADELVVERDDYREKFRTMEREAELLRSQLIAMQLRAENAESALRNANAKIVRLEERVGIYSSQPRE